MIKLLIADDHAIIRHGVRNILEMSHLAITIDETTTGTETINAVINHPYDILLLDINFPDKNGLEVFNQVQTIQPHLKVLFLSMYPEEQYARRALKLGAFGYLMKDSATSELVTAIQKVMSGSKYVTLSLAELLADELSSPTKVSLHESLSNRELEVMLALAKGKTISQISSDLSLSSKTVSTYYSRVLKKLNLNNLAELVHYAIKNNLIN